MEIADKVTDSIVCTLNGQTEAFEALVVRYQKPIFKFLLGLGVSSSAIEDIAQDVFLSAYINLKTFDANKAQFSTWLFTIAKNKAINHLRKKKIKTFFGFSNETIQQFESEQVVSGPTVEKELREELLFAMRSLTQEYRTACVLYFYNELTIEEIADIEKCSTGTVKSRLFRAKQILKEQLKGKFYDWQ